MHDQGLAHGKSRRRRVLGLVVGGVVTMSTTCPGLLAVANASSVQPASTGARSVATSQLGPGQVVANELKYVELVASNLLGQNAPAISAIEADYVEMWAQDVAAILEYFGSS